MTLPCLRAIDPVLLADAAVGALLAEAELTPKPGLVDRSGRGAHDDMDLALLRRSAQALRPWFVAFAEAARDRSPGRELRRELGALGRAAEAAMLAATGGVNTHRGAIWALGLLTAAVALRPPAPDVRTVTGTAAAVARYADDACPPGALLTHGARVRGRFSVHGARGQAQDGFPHVVDVALPALRSARRAGAGEEVARLTALLRLMATLDDTCVLYRGGRGGLDRVQRGAAEVLRAGGPGTPRGRRLLDSLDGRLARARLSPGGSADILAATIFLDSLDLAEV